MRFVEETDGKSFVQVNDGSKKDEKEYASKGVAGTALGLGIAGTALWLLNGGLGNCGLFGRGCGASAAEVAISSNEQYLERKECEDMVAEHADFNLWRRTCRMITGELVLPDSPTVTGYPSYNPCHPATSSSTPAA